MRLYRKIHIGEMYSYSVFISLALLARLFSYLYGYGAPFLVGFFSSVLFFVVNPEVARKWKGVLKETLPLLSPFNSSFSDSLRVRRGRRVVSPTAAREQIQHFQVVPQVPQSTEQEHRSHNNDLAGSIEVEADCKNTRIHYNCNSLAIQRY